MITGKIRVRLGMRLSWPIVNAATVVRYLSPADVAMGRELMGRVREFFRKIGWEEGASRLIFDAEVEP